MRFYVYILYSAQLERHYSGFSQYHGKRRRQHSGKNPNWTARACDWTEVFCHTVSTRAEARGMEKRIKARGAKRFMADWVARQVADLGSPGGGETGHGAPPAAG